MTEFSRAVYENALTDEFRSVFDYLEAALEEDECGLLDEAANLLMELEIRAFQLGFLMGGKFKGVHPMSGKITERVLPAHPHLKVIVGGAGQTGKQAGQ
jgi:hypothetical protein